MFARSGYSNSNCSSPGDDSTWWVRSLGARRPGRACRLTRIASGDGFTVCAQVRGGAGRCGLAVPGIRLRDGLAECVDLAALVPQHGGQDLLKGPLTVAEPRLAGRGHGVELLVGHLRERAEGMASGRESPYQLRGVGGMRRVGVAVSGCADMTTLGAALGKIRDSQVCICDVLREGCDGSVAELFSSCAGLAQDGLVRGGQERLKLGDLSVGGFEHLAAAVAHSEFEHLSGRWVRRRR